MAHFARRASIVVLAFGSILTPATVAHAAPKTVVVTSEFDFCSFLPKTPGEAVGDSENDAIPFCTLGNLSAPGAKVFPPGFITSAHFAEGTGYVQVTGTIDRTKYKLSPNDGGGQYDTNAPPGAMALGYKNFVNLVEPDVNRFCIRACADTTKCNVTESTQGCEAVVPGDYS